MVSGCFPADFQGPTHQTHRFVQVRYTPGLVITLICKIIFGIMRSRHFHITNGPRFSGSRSKTTLSEISAQPVLGTPECDGCVHTGPNELYLCPEFVWFDLNDASVNTATDCVQINPNGLQQWAKLLHGSVPPY